MNCNSIYSKNSWFIWLVLLGLLTQSGCYSFKGIGIATEIKTYYVNTFDNKAVNVVPTLSQTFTESLRQKIRTESRLTANDTDPDIEFKGSIVNYRVSSVAPKPGETTAFSRLEITVQVEYINHKDEEDTWSQNFPYFNDFESSQNLISIQDELIENINEQLVEDIFNKAFTNW